MPGDDMQEDVTFDDDDIEILDGDVTRTMVNGLISIRPPSELKQHVGPSKGSRFNPLPDEFDDVVEIENVVDSAPAEGAIPPATAPHHKGKPISVLKKQREIPIHKPLRVTLNDFPIVAKSATKPSSLCSTQMRNNTTTLDKTRHSSIVISENSDPNLQIPALAHNATPACTNTLTLGKSPDTRTALHAELNAEDMCLNQTSYMATVDSRLDAHTLFTADDIPDGRLAVNRKFPPLPQEVVSSLGDIPWEQEIHEALMAMAPLKSPGWDGNGRTIDVLKDVWIPTFGPLYHHLLDHTAIYRGFTFSDLMNDGGLDILQFVIFFYAPPMESTVELLICFSRLADMKSKK
ncbi:hypothetical protein V6N12_051058 [Hibiscus sabdariffa]|uniref:Uncharacterized protein n=1 Tax=Hibiscus sabdariffa TaxID=183260 RepID=A0ABR2GFC3_9ROSI